MASVLGFESGGAQPRRGRFDRSATLGAGALDGLVSREIVPRLLIAQIPAEPLIVVSTGRPITITAAEVERFARLALAREAHALLAEAEAFLGRGVAVDTLFVELLAPAARLLGRGWEDDSIDFVDVTMGLWRLQEVLREISARVPTANDRGAGRRALFTPMPGEQHSFGTAMVAECFGQVGWDAELLIDAGRSDLLRRVANDPVDLLGLTVSCDSHIEQLRPLIAALRNVACTPRLQIMIGGRVATLNPGLAAIVGADATAPTAIEAVAVAERLVGSRCAASV